MGVTWLVQRHLTVNAHASFRIGAADLTLATRSFCVLTHSTDGLRALQSMGLKDSRAMGAETRIGRRFGRKPSLSLAQPVADFTSINRVVACEMIR